MVIMGLRERKKEKRRSLIVQEFSRLLTLHGLYGFTMKDISDSLDISLRTLYNYYESKEDLVADYIGNRLISQLEEVKKLGLLTGQDFCQDMYNLLSWFFKVHFSDENLKEVWVRDFFEYIESLERAKKYEKVYNHLVTLIYNVICLHQDKLKEASFLLAEVYVVIFKGTFFKIIKSDFPLEQALKELKKKIEIVYKGVGLE